MDDLIGCVYINGEYADARDARISVFDLGLIGSIAVFDTIGVWKGKIFKLERHIQRFLQSVHAAALPLRVPGDDLPEIVLETVRRSGLRDAVITLIATRGYRTVTMAPSRLPTQIVYVVPYTYTVPKEKIPGGIKIIVPAIRNTAADTLDPKIKNYNRMHAYLAGLEAQRAGADDVVFLDGRGFLTEARGSNVFLVRRGELVTPNQGILHGITRETVFEIAGEAGIAVHTRDLTPVDLYVADEVFFSSTAGGIIPVVEADGRTIGSGMPGTLTRRIYDRYWERHLDGPDTTPIDY